MCLVSFAQLVHVHAFFILVSRLGALEERYVVTPHGVGGDILPYALNCPFVGLVTNDLKVSALFVSYVLFKFRFVSEYRTQISIGVCMPFRRPCDK